ncbi:hypothetical protein GGX14DRAFT_407951 [Mycena pura]|uniref:Uncharacterized protein n=1 Tax=Mycena pura TaxID=153505 RepID=A0AAD6UQ92_9AGAR|nr:hypothetical protein GGX14DRAFT_407951 [Mycena pura]
MRTHAHQTLQQRLPLQQVHTLHALAAHCELRLPQRGGRCTTPAQQRVTRMPSETAQGAQGREVDGRRECRVRGGLNAVWHCDTVHQKKQSERENRTPPTAAMQAPSVAPTRRPCSDSTAPSTILAQECLAREVPKSTSNTSHSASAGGSSVYARWAWADNEDGVDKVEDMAEGAGTGYTATASMTRKHAGVAWRCWRVVTAIHGREERALRRVDAAQGTERRCGEVKVDLQQYDQGYQQTITSESVYERLATRRIRPPPAARARIAKDRPPVACQTRTCVLRKTCSCRPLPAARESIQRRPFCPWATLACGVRRAAVGEAGEPRAAASMRREAESQREAASCDLQPAGSSKRAASSGWWKLLVVDPAWTDGGGEQRKAGSRRARTAGGVRAAGASQCVRGIWKAPHGYGATYCPR